MYQNTYIVKVIGYTGQFIIKIIPLTMKLLIWNTHLIWVVCYKITCTLSECRRILISYWRSNSFIGVAAACDTMLKTCPYHFVDIIKRWRKHVYRLSSQRTVYLPIPHFRYIDITLKVKLLYQCGGPVWVICMEMGRLSFIYVTNL